MEAQLRIPFRDTAADDLVWRLGDPRRPALATLCLEVAGGRLELRLLGSSHQVLLTGDDTVISEVVACGLPGTSPDEANSLPPVAERRLGGWGYRFRSRTLVLPPARFGRRIDALVTRLADHPAALVGRFPGSPHAVTALLAGPGPGGAGVRWRTWHAYPQDGRLVATSTTVEPR